MVHQGAYFLAGLVFAAAAAVIGVGRPELAMWIVSVCAYAAIANDSIQTIGTFIASNRHRPWWHQWLFIGEIFGYCDLLLDELQWRCQLSAFGCQGF